MTVSVYEGEAFAEMEKVAKQMLKGHTEYKVARDLGMKVVEVRALWSAYKERLDNDSMATDAAREHLNLMVKQFDDLLVELNDNLANLKTLAYDEKISAQIVSTTRTIGDLQAKRVDLLQKAGLLDAHDLGDELAERERQEEVIVDILRNELCPDCQAKIANKLQKVTGEVEVIQVEDTELPDE